MKNYEVIYRSTATGYGWTQKYEHLSAFVSFLREMERDASAIIMVWDWMLGKMIYYKRGGEFKPTEDALDRSHDERCAKCRVRHEGY